MTTVMLVDDHTLVREAVANLLAEADGLTVTAQAGTLDEAFRIASGDLPDVVVIDVSLTDGNGLNLVRDLRKRSASVGLVVLTMHDDDPTLFAALDAGASALVLKSSPSDAIIRAVRQAAAAPMAFAADGLAGAVRRQGSSPTLTVRETEVLQLLADGHSVALVARRLYMSESTVKTHISKIYDKLGARNRASAVMAAVRLGLVRVSETVD